MWSHVICSIRYALREKWEKVSPQKPQSFSKAQWQTHTHPHTHIQVEHVTLAAVLLVMSEYSKKKYEKNMQKFVNVTDCVLLHLIGSNHIQAPPVSSSQTAIESGAPGLPLVAFIGWSDSNAWAAFGSATWVRAAATGTGADDGGSYSWLSFCHHSFPPVGRNQEVRSGLFYTGSVFFRTLRSLCGSGKECWFIRLGMDLCVCLIALHEWKREPACEKPAAPQCSCSRVILEDFGRRSLNTSK